MDEDLARFMSITNATRDEALMFLEMSNGDVDNAVSLYFDNAPSAPPPPKSTSRGSSASPSVSAMDDDEVRAPIAPRRSNLMAELHGGPAGHMPNIVAIGQGMRGGRMSGAASQHQSVFTTNAEPGNARHDLLAELFKPPTKIMFIGSLEEAFAAAQQRQQFVIVHLMQQGNFQCEAQNRDLWNMPDVQEAVQGRFLFVQYEESRPEGAKYQQIYGPAEFPHIAILDPRTRERMQLIEYTIDREELKQLLDDFIASQTAAPEQPKRLRISELDEEEQLRLAMEASLAEARAAEVVAAASSASSAAAASSSSSSSSSSAAAAPPKVEQPPAAPSHPSLSAAAVALPENPSNAANATRVQIRFQDGSRVVLRIGKDDRVGQLFGHLRATRPELADRPFELAALNIKASERMGATIDEAGLANASLNCVDAI